ncbi:MAG: hypothetical protein A2Y15_04665 [Clostridiales bacterium GWF2_36_10]|nr:MAG: hypothetical protein A2Y15_04665 [Clostridiales bacterium GWF2_36_10]HAN20875.1 hypothetical protein [Clostridiales bacterium]
MKDRIIKKRVKMMAAILSCISIFLTGCNAKINTDESSSSSDTNSETTSDAPSLPEVRTLCGSFIQSWLVRNWSQTRWDTECQNMADAGMKYIILQSVVDLTYNTDTQLGQNPDTYVTTGVNSLYPSDLLELKSANTGNDALKKCLEACKKTGIQVIIGLVSDNRWWLYGWGLPKMPDGSTDIITNSYFAKFIEENADISNKIADEIYQKYGNDYKDQIYCWYYNNEIWNIDIACKGTDGGVYAKLLSNSFNLYLRYFNQITPGMPMMLSPFINPTLSTPDECGKMWKDIFKLTEFREGDIFSPQDSFGGNPSLDLDKWWVNYKAAADAKPGLILWANNENFREGGSVATINEFVNKQINVTSKYAEANICFSWNHYYSPLQRNPGYNKSYVYYVQNGKLETESPSKPVLTANGLTITWDAIDNKDICGFRVFDETKTRLIATVEIGKEKNSVIQKTYKAEKAGKYYISVYDFSGNESELTEITLP